MGTSQKIVVGVTVDAHPFHAWYCLDILMTFPPEGGAFTVWPGSHKIFYYDYKSQYKNEPGPQYDVDRERLSREPGVECHGNAGDIVFWHHRIGHAAVT